MILTNLPYNGCNTKGNEENLLIYGKGDQVPDV
jgi:hypothetical protein